jgi:hypothetical protein
MILFLWNVVSLDRRWILTGTYLHFRLLYTIHYTMTYSIENYTSLLSSMTKLESTQSEVEKMCKNNKSTHEALPKLAPSLPHDGLGRLFKSALQLTRPCIPPFTDSQHQFSSRFQVPHSTSLCIWVSYNPRR